MKRALLISAACAVFAAEAATLGTYSSIVPATDTVMFTGVSLADVKSVSAWMAPASLGTGGKNAIATAYHYSNDGTTLTVQFQAYLGDYTKGVVLQLTQDGSDIKGKALYTRYVNDQYHNHEGSDMSSGWSNGSYQIRDVTLSDEDDSHLRTKLYWNGASGDTWDGTTANWLTESGAATAWVPGARAVFPNAAAMTVNVVASGITASHFTMKGWPVTFTGGTITMVGASEVIMYSGLARFECQLAGANGFRVANCIYQYDLAAHTVLSATSQALFQNATLAGISNLISTASGNSVGVGSTPQQSYFLENDGSTLTAQMQWYGGGYTKCVFLELTQQGSDICGRVTRAAYINDSKVDCRGVDFRTHPKATNSRTFTGSGEAVYGMCDLHLSPRVELAADNTFTGMIRADNYATIALVGGTLGGGTFSGPIIIYRTTLEISHAHQTLNGGLSDSAGASTAGRLVVKGMVDPAGGTLSYSGKLPNAKTVIFHNANLSAWTAVSAQVGPDSMSDKSYPPATPFFFRHCGTDSLRVQFQIKDDPNNKYVKCMLYEFTQEGNDIACRKVGGGYKTGWDSYFGHDFENVASDINSSSSYACYNLVATCTNATDTAVALGASNAYYGGTEIDGALVVLKVGNALPTAEGLVTTMKGDAKLVVDVNRPDSSKGVLGQSTVNVTEGSYLRFGRFRSNGAQTIINATDGSEVSIAGGNGNNTQDFGYLSHLTLSGGAFVTGDAFRTGYEGSDAVSGITVTGDEVVRIDPPIHVLRSTMNSSAENYANQWKLNVADVSVGADPDLYLNGELLNYAQNDGVLAGRPIEKTGAGTVRLGAANSYTGSVSIVEGAVLLGTNGAFNADINLTLAGGTLDAGTSTNAVGSLSIISNSTIAVAAGAAVAFTASSTQDWGHNRLTITGASGSRTLRFGTDGNGLTPDQVKQIRWDGSRVKLDANGYLAPHTYGLTVSIK